MVKISLARSVASVSILIALLYPMHFFPTVSAQTQNTEHTLKLDEGAKPASAELGEFEWLVGRWDGEGLGGQCEEVFLPVWNDTMVGSFRYAREGKLAFSEFFSLVKSDGGVILKLKHFHPDMIGWEEKDKMVNFPLVKVEKHAAYFAGLTYKLNDQGELKVWVAMKGTDGKLGEAAFTLRRAIMEPSSGQ
jgi:hypothetical protein